ncbi:MULTISPECIES: YdcF family protein [unclassified Synechococcus]|uniref:YdcF family protein n=1 Tax=unclassified Synechococcus TaxID=2626047 RepID=UPI0021A83704|nr:MULTISPECIES: YdcF family protein [unclassified Synechococcus]MCT0211931.1 YdcF family protein [Synechococcus sp. CS-1326]MCT0232343.1 YdcF family protein [Synechococcus sp. CS-1327]
MRRLLPWALLGLALVGLVQLTRPGPLPVPSFALSPAAQPQLILVLGGDVARERRAGQLAQRYRLPVVVSGGSNPEYAQWLFHQEGLGPHQYQLDYRARDTVTNFTTVVDDLKGSGIRHVLLVTSSDHMERALLVGRIIAGSRGIQLTPVTVPCGPRCLPERRSKVWRDGFRALVWVISGRDPAQWAVAGK